MSKRKAPEPSSSEDVARIIENLPEVEVLDLATLKKQVLAFEKKYSKNQMMRLKYPEDPEKFLESELELHEEITRLQSLATAPELYAEFCKLGAAKSLVGLLSHENTDIALAVIEVVQELTEADVVMEAEDSMILIDSLLENSLVEQLVGILERLNEDATDEDANGVHNILSIFENLSEINVEGCERACDKSRLLSWMLNRLHKKDLTENRIFCSEIMSIMTQASPMIQKKIGEDGGVDKLLRLAALYKQTDPHSEEETELIENIYNTICTCILHQSNKQLFIQEEGIELMLITIKHRKYCARLALKTLDYLLQDCASGCEQFIALSGLSTLCPCFIHTKAITKSKKKDIDVRVDEEHVVSIFFSLLKHLGSEGRVRVLIKLSEDEKLLRLASLFQVYQQHVASCDDQLQQPAEQSSDDGFDENVSPEERAYMKRLESGLLTLQQCAFMLAVVLTAQPATQQSMLQLIDNHSITIAQITTHLYEFLQTLEKAAAEDEEKEEKGESNPTDATRNAEMISRIRIAIQQLQPQEN